MNNTVVTIVLGILYYVGFIAAERMNRDLKGFDENFPVIQLAWILWPLTIFAFFLFYFLIPGVEKSDKAIPRFIRWYNRKQSK